MFERMHEIFKLLNKLQPKIARAWGERYFVRDITRPQARILMLIDDNGPLSVSEIATALDMADSNASNICSRLEKAGYVVRMRQEDDQRVVKIELTAEAAPIIEESEEKASKFYKEVSALITEKDVEEILTGLAKLNVLIDVIIENHM